ncbi:hypothetical protein IQ243_29225 [Nostocales cyanobacterium LEGE 11386]|nr:hypothetical protein [Nostocales cyanobacterium LEGE 11386]
MDKLDQAVQALVKKIQLHESGTWSSPKFVVSEEIARDAAAYLISSLATEEIEIINAINQAAEIQI